MLEGKELEGNLGGHGKYSVDVTPDGKIILSVEIDALDAIEGLLEKSSFGQKVADFLDKIVKKQTP